MNRIFNIVWNRSLGGWTVASEHARQRGKSGGACRALVSVVALAPACAFAADLPTGGNVVSGNGSIATGGQDMTVTQSSARLAIDWQSFDIGQDNKVTFEQPGKDAVALNRVTGSDGSKIMGTLQANGRVFIVNPNGVLFGQDARVEVGGLVASTLDIANEDFEKGNYRFKGDGDNAAVTNRGNITAADGGAVALLGGTVSNRGTIVANQGSVALAAGNAVTLDFAGDGLLNVQVDESVADALVENRQLIKADGGQVIMTARASDALLKTVVNNDGIIEAQTLGEKNGRIVLDGGDDGSVQVAGTLDASATLPSPPPPLPQAGEGSQAADALGITAPRPQEESRIASLTGSTGNRPSPMHGRGAGGEGNGGSIEVTGRHISLTGATLDASGTTGGGTIKVGGDWQGSGTLAHAKTTTVDTKTTLKADATEQGDGGKVVVWSDEKTTYAGSISAKGGKQGGNGGKAEVSGKAVLAFEGKVDLTAEQGRTGDLLLDPYDLTIVDGTGGDVTATEDDSTLGADTLETQLETANVTVSTGTGGTQDGDISVASAVEWSADTVLTLQAAGSIDVDADITATGDSAGLVLSYGSTGSYSLNDGARITLSGDAATLSIGETGSLASYTLIHDVTALQAMSLSGYYALAEDIDASATSAWNGGAGFAPIGTVGGSEFGATLAGLGHAIDGLTIKRSSNATGLFGATSGTTIRDLTLSNAAIVGMARTGALIGDAYGTTLTNIHITGTVTGYQEVGGIAGWFGDSSLTDSSSTARVTATVNAAGGLAGYGYYGVGISDSYSVGAVSAGDQAGGLIGRASGATTTLSNVYASGAITGSNAGGLIGVANGGTTFTTTNAYWDMTTTGQGTSPTGTGIANSNAFTQATYAGFDFTNTWVMIAGQTRPMLRNEYSTVIHTPHALQLMSLAPSGSYRLGTNLSLAATAGNSGEIWGASGFFPIGDNSTPFTGTFNGQSHTITGLTINRGATDYVGLFGDISGATISNVALEGGSVTGKDYVGTLIGSMSGGEASGVSTSATVAGGTNTGGLIGVSSGAITLAASTGDVTATGSVVGGLIGNLRIGGSIAQSYSAGTVSGGAATIGGFIGQNNGTITDSYSLGSVTAENASGYAVGGFAGSNNIGTITNAYSTGYVSGSSFAGGFVGLNGAGASAITHTYWDTQTSGQSSGIYGGTAADLTGKTTAELQTASTYADWDISSVGGESTIWRIYEGSTTPLLRGFLTTLTVTGTPDYDGSGTALDNLASVTWGSSDADSSHLSGSATSTDGDTLTLTGTAAGEYTATSNATTGALYSDQQGYDIVYGSAMRTISDANVANAGDIALTHGAAWESGTLAIDTSGTVTASGTIEGGSASVFDLVNGSWVQNAGGSTLADFSVNDFRLSGGSFLRVLDGDGTESDPYQVADVYGLQGIGSSTAYLSAYWTLAGDIDASGTENWNCDDSGDCEGFDPLGDDSTNFTGKFDGLYHIVSHSTINRGENNVGLFGTTSTGATVARIGLENASISGWQFVGGLVGRNRGSISEAYVSGSVNGGYYYVGGLAGGNTDGGTITDAYSTASVRGYWDVGGVVGYNPGGSLNRVYATGAVSKTGGGGIGGLIGYAGSATDSYYGETTGLGGLTTAQMQQLATYANWNISTNGGENTVWRIYESNSTPLLRGFLSAVTVGIDASASKTYDGSAASGSLGSYTATLTDGSAADASLIDGTLAYATTGANAGSYTLADGTLSLSGLYSGQQGYDIGYAGSASYVIDPATLTYMANKSHSTYGEAPYGLTGTVTGFVDGETLANATTGTLTFTTDASGQSDVGSYAITGSGLSAGNYVFVQASGNATALTIDPAALTITASDASKTYGQRTASLSGYTVDGLVNDDSVSSVDLSSAGAASTATVGSYTITASNADGTDLSNYAISYVDGTLTVAKAGLTITTSDASKTYGETASLNGYTVDGLLNGDGVSSVDLASAGTANTATVGSYTITASDADGTGLSNYDIGYVDGTLTVGKAGLTITASDASKTYGQTASLTGYSVSGLLNGDGVNGVDLASASTASTATVGSYTITASDADGTGLSNYDISYVDGTLTVAKAGLTITASDAGKTYGETASPNGYTVDGLLNGDGVSGVDLASAGTASTATVGSYTITASDADGTGLSNYDISYVDGTLTVGKAGLTITASDASKTYGETANLNGYTVDGLLNGDGVSGVDLASDGTASTATVGHYTITASDADGTGLSNYAIGYVDGTLTVGKAGLTITANDAGKTYGETASLTGYTVDGLINGDSVSSIDLASTGKTATATVGSYTISASNADGTGLSNYAIGYAGGTLTVGKAGLTITANDAGKTYDGLAFSGGNGVSYSGFVEGEDASVLSGTLVYGGSAQGAVDAGGYELSAGGLTSGNYAIAYLPGSLTITPAIPVVAEPSRLFQPPAAYADILASVHDNERKPLAFGEQRDPYQVIDTGIRLPEGI